MKTLELIGKLRAAVDGLLYPSESDEPFEVIDRPLGEGMTATVAVEELVGPKRPIVRQTVDEFFAALEGSDDEERFMTLRKLVDENLADLSVCRVGEVQVDVYLLGRAGDRLVGVKTLSVET